MTKFEIRTDAFEFRMGTKQSRISSMSASEIMDTYFSGDTRITSNSNDPAARESFDNEDIARAFFRKHYASYGRTRLERGSTEWLLRGKIAWLEQNEYDEDGEFDQGGGVLEFSAEPYNATDDKDEEGE